jgi:hypothetical protein
MDTTAGSPLQTESRSDRTPPLLDAVFAAVAAWRDRILAPSDRQRDAYLACSVDRIDLEQRIRNWERRPASFWNAI